MLYTSVQKSSVRWKTAFLSIGEALLSREGITREELWELPRGVIWAKKKAEWGSDSRDGMSAGADNGLRVPKTTANEKKVQ